MAIAAILFQRIWNAISARLKDALNAELAKLDIFTH